MSGDHNHTPSDAELQAIVGASMDMVPALYIDPEDGKQMTHDAHKAVTDLGRLMARAAAMLGAGDADEAVVLGYDHTARCVYAEVNLPALFRVTVENMPGPQIKRNDLLNGEATAAVMPDAVRLFLHGPGGGFEDDTEEV